MDHKIELTQQELEDVKDDVKWRTSMTIYMKQLKEIPKRVDSLEIHRIVHWALMIIIIGGLLSFKFMAK